MVKCITPKCRATIKPKFEATHVLCYDCFVKEKHGVNAMNENAARLRNVNIRRHQRGNWRRKKDWVCEMGYSDCTAERGCNGDC